jgi:small subunit ribosomal protein S5
MSKNVLMLRGMPSVLWSHSNQELPIGHRFNYRRVSNKKVDSFRPNRKPDKRYRPIVPKPKKRWDRSLFNVNPHMIVKLGEVPNPKDELEARYGPLAAGTIRKIRKERDRKMGKTDIDYDDPVDETMRSMDYMLTLPGSAEDQVFERRALSLSFDNDDERNEYMQKLQKMVEEGRLRDFHLDPETLSKYPLTGSLAEGEVDHEDDNDDDEEKDSETYLDPNQVAFGEWAEMLITVDRNVKLWRGGRLESYRALVIGGNMNGCGGFGTGKSTEPLEAVAKASRVCKRNIFFVERYQNCGLTRNLVGIQNNCKLVIRTTDNGLRGNPLVAEILKRFGITNAASKAYGKRNPYNVVQATFKALMTHETLEQIAMKRGKRLMSMDKAMRLQI